MWITRLENIGISFCPGSTEQAQKQIASGMYKHEGCTKEEREEFFPRLKPGTFSVILLHSRIARKEPLQ
jgi:hypothetical protein